MTFTAKNGWKVEARDTDLGWTNITIGDRESVDDNSVDDVQFRITTTQYDALVEFFLAQAEAERNAWMDAGGGEVWHFVLDDDNEFDAVTTSGTNTRHWTAANDVPLPYAFLKHVVRSWKVMTLTPPRKADG